MTNWSLKTRGFYPTCLEYFPTKKPMAAAWLNKRAADENDTLGTLVAKTRSGTHKAVEAGGEWSQKIAQKSGELGKKAADASGPMRSKITEEGAPILEKITTKSRELGEKVVKSSGPKLDKIVEQSKPAMPDDSTITGDQNSVKKI